MDARSRLRMPKKLGPNRFQFCRRSGNLCESTFEEPRLGTCRLQIRSEDHGEGRFDLTTAMLSFSVVDACTSDHNGVLFELG